MCAPTAAASPAVSSRIGTVCETCETTLWSSPMTSPTPAAPGPTPPRRPWRVIYYLLAAFNILIVCGSLYLNYRVTDLYVHAVASNQDWGQLMADYLALERLASDANAAGNDVFETRDPARESKRMRSAHAAFDERMAALRKDLADSAPPASVPSLREGLAEIERTMGGMVAEAEQVFAALSRQDEAATRHMAAMDRWYAELLAAFREQRARFGLARAPRPVRAPESPSEAKLPRWQRFERQTSLAASMQRWEWVTGGLIGLMVAGAVVYGRRLAQQMDEDGRERARYIAALSEARETLEQRVLERTEALRRSEAELRGAASEWQQTFEAIESPVLLVDLDGRLVRANRAASVRTGPSDEALAGRLLTAIGGGEPWRCAAGLVARVAESRQSAAAQVHDPASGGTWDVAANLVSHLGQGERAIVVARDITRMVELQERVGREERMTAMGSLVAGVAHEVRNPLFGISGTLETLSARLGPNATFDKYFAMLKRDVARLRSLMQDLLDYGKPARLALAPTDLEAVVAEAIRACEPLAEGRRVAVEIPDGLPAVSMDRPRMVQVFENLIRNALQHSPPGGRVIVGAETKDPQAVCCSVRDFGPGFPGEDLPRLFEPFFTKREGGTGLGLSIAQRIVEEHGGFIVAENHREGGAAVRLTLRLAGAKDA
jgi:signal transduction histidine kinase